MNSDIFKKIIEDHKELSSLPQTLVEVLRVTKDEKSSAKDLASVLSRDPALTAKMLRIVNSAFYGNTKGITTLSQAVVTLGTRAVTALALSTSIYDLTDKWEISIDRVRFWRHSLEVAIACRTIAEAIRYPRVEEAFVSGILHDIGILVLEKSFPEKFKTIWDKTEGGESLIDLEENVWNTNHARVGQFLLEQWNIPSLICEAVGQHHNSYPPETYESEYCLAQIVVLGSRIAKFTTAKVKPDISLDIESKEIIRNNLKLPPDRLKSIEEKLFYLTVEEAKFLEIDIGSTEDILIEANQLLYHHYLTVENLLRENSKMQQDIAKSKMEKVSLETLKTITATFNHYINNAAGTILGRAQLIELSLENGEIIDSKGKIPHAINVILHGVNTIQLVLTELKNLNSIPKTLYYNDTYIIDIENRIKEELEKLDKKEKPLPVN